jgi:hypothetical protein
MEIKDFYIHLGKLLYAVAMADGEVQDEEIQELYKLVISELSDESLFNQDEVNVFHTEFEFEALMDKNASKQEAFNSFLKYFDENHDNFTEQMKKITVYAVEQIAKAFEGIVDEEEEMLTELKTRLKLI